jgi:hypothetical protein
MATKKDANSRSRFWMALATVIVGISIGNYFGLGWVYWVMVVVGGKVVMDSNIFKRIICSECGNKVEPESKICPTCNSQFQEPENKK